jgi:uncharacterized protein YcbK (DUF882 family)
MPMDRRRFLTASLAAAGGLCPIAKAVAAAPDVHRLRFYHIHTGEKLDIVYREKGLAVAEALTEINRYLRDFRTDQVHEIDLNLLDTLHELFTTFEGRGNFEVISGYRSPRTNAALRHATTGVAENSLHIQGRAIDARLTSAKTAAVRDAAISLRRGGVGYYPESNFVHLDTGAFRSW